MQNDTFIPRIKYEKVVKELIQVKQALDYAEREKDDETELTRYRDMLILCGGIIIGIITTVMVVVFS